LKNPNHMPLPPKNASDMIGAGTHLDVSEPSGLDFALQLLQLAADRDDRGDRGVRDHHLIRRLKNTPKQESTKRKRSKPTRLGGSGQRIEKSTGKRMGRSREHLGALGRGVRGLRRRRHWRWQELSPATLHPGLRPRTTRPSSDYPQRAALKLTLHHG
jgi:hypothetical protein